MLDHNYFKGLESCWDRLRKCQKKIYAYGTGNGCEKLIRLLKQKGIVLDGIFVSDDFSRGQSFCGYDVKSLSELEKEGGDFLAVLAFGTSLPEVMSRIDNLEENCEVLAPDMALFSDEAFEKEFFLEHFKKAEFAYDLLSDQRSKETFEKLTAFKITGKLKFLREIFSSANEGYDLLDLGREEIYCDLGAYNGDTVRSFLERTEGRYSKIIALEPEKRNFQKCLKNCQGLDNFTLLNAAAWNKDTLLSFSGAGGRQGQVNNKGEKSVPARSLDSILNGGKCTYIKYDVEGADFPALEGSAKTIQKFSPKISAAVYHHPYDYFEIPAYINKINGGYRFYLRQSVYYPAWETNLYAIK